jgi:hypothetical protein
LKEYQNYNSAIAAPTKAKYKRSFIYGGKCKVTMKYDWKGIQSKVFDGEKS